MPEKFSLMMGTYALGTPYDGRLSRRPLQEFQIAHRNLCHTFCVPEHPFEDVEEIISGDVLWYDT